MRKDLSKASMATGVGLVATIPWLRQEPQHDASGEAADDESSAAVLGEEIRDSVESFLSVDPDLLRLNRVLASVAAVASLDEDSIVVDDDGSRAATLRLPEGVAARATVRLRPDNSWQVELGLGEVVVGGRRYWDCMVVASQDRAAGTSGGIVQYHPNPRERPSGTEIVGYTFSASREGGSLHPLVMAPEGAGIRIGHVTPDDPFQPKDIPFLEVRGIDAWRGVVAQLRQP